MENLIFTMSVRIFKMIGTMIICGTFATALVDVQKHAFEKRKTGLVSMLKINQQLVGRTH